VSKELILKTEAINKSFGITRAVVDVSIEINRGEIRGLIGENGSGKSTLSSIIAGEQHADSGNMYLNGEKFEPASMIDAQSKGVSMVVQEMGTIPNLTVAENIFIGKEDLFKKSGLVNKKAMNLSAKQILEEIGAGDIRYDTAVKDLNFEDRKLVEIARAVYTKPQILIFDETTTALSQKGREIVYRIMKKYQQKNRAILFISHDLEELSGVCNVVTVLRDGRLIDTLDKDQMEINKMKELMVGRKLTGDYYRSDFDGSCRDEVVMKVEQLTVGPVLSNFSMEVHKGEILGIGGLTDCGMHDLGKALFGIMKPIGGKVTILPSNQAVRNTNTAIRNKIGYVSKNRDIESLILNASIKDNTVLPSLNLLKRFGLISNRRENDFTKEQIDYLNIKCRSGKQYCSDLSGGNKQKVAIGRWMGNKSEIIIFDCPTRGIDIGVKAAIYKLLYKLKSEGKSIIMISEELPELIGMSDRIIIIKNGVQSAMFDRSKDMSEHQIINKMI